MKENLKSLIERLRCLAGGRNSYVNYVDQKIRSENLQCNLSLIISHILLKLQFFGRNKEVFESIIDEYNKANSRTLTFDKFKKNDWKRIISEDVVILGLVRRFMFIPNFRVEQYNKLKDHLALPAMEDRIFLIITREL